VPSLVQAQWVHWQHCTRRVVATRSRYMSYEEVSKCDDMPNSMASQPY
jgi:hypothetical protein